MSNCPFQIEPMSFSSPFLRCLFIAVSRHYSIEAVRKELIEMGWKEDSCKLIPEIIERSIQEMSNLVLHGDPP
jgi:hypothetical protein